MAARLTSPQRSARHPTAATTESLSGPAATGPRLHSTGRFQLGLTHLEYHNCLLREGSQYSKCNMPNGEMLDNSPAGMRTAPTGDGEVACVAENRPNATSVLSGCCGSELGVYGYGCYAWCLGGGNLQQCIDDNQELGSGTIVFCRSANDSSREDSDNDGDSSDGASRSGATRPVTSTTVLVFAVAAMLLGETLL
jgi:hypothetical protein